jgi:putative transposase
MPLHVIQRGNNRVACFVSDADRLVYLAMLKDLSKLFPTDLHAFVLMTNHVHLLATPRQRDNVSLLMKHLGQRYVQYFNRTHNRTGSLWEGRFKSSIVECDGYLLSCQRYIELNPVRAGMVKDPSDYPWSSFRANALGDPGDLLTAHPVYLALGKSPPSRARNYVSLFDESLSAEALTQIRDAINGGFALGGKGFVATLERLMERRVSRGKAGRPKRESAEAA